MFEVVLCFSYVFFFCKIQLNRSSGNQEITDFNIRQYLILKIMECAYRNITGQPTVNGY